MKMKLVLLSVLMTLFALPSFAQSWMTDYDEAMAQAIQEDKHVLLFFTGSDWCPPCKRIKKDIYTSEKFVTYADEKLVLLVADFPRKRANKLSDKQEAKNRKLAAEYGIKSFPTTIILNTEGKELKRWLGYQPGSPEDYLDKFNDAISL